MLICMSSGSRALYRQDILRALAMPTGSQLQFRYAEKWIAPGIVDRLEAMNREQCLIAYIDQAEKGKPIMLIPCRFAVLERATRHGTSASLQMTLGDFALAADLQAFNREVATASGNTVPAWQPGGQILGYYWSEIGSVSNTVVADAELVTWEAIVTQLAKHSDFSNETCFYHVTGVHQVGQERALSWQNGTLTLDANRDYELWINHFHPRGHDVVSWLKCAATGPQVEIITGHTVYIDSRYDLKRIRFRSLPSPGKRCGVLTLFRGTGDVASSQGSFDFDLPLCIRDAACQRILWGLGLGVLLAAPQIIAAYADPGLPCDRLPWIWIGSLVCGCGAGLVASFGLRRQV